AGIIEGRRRSQLLEWLEDLLREEWLNRLRSHPAMRRLRPGLEQAVLRREITPSNAARSLLEACPLAIDRRRAGRRKGLSPLSTDSNSITAKVNAGAKRPAPRSRGAHKSAVSSLPPV